VFVAIVLGDAQKFRLRILAVLALLVAVSPDTRPKIRSRKQKQEKRTKLRREKDIKVPIVIVYGKRTDFRTSLAACQLVAPKPIRCAC
jgi:hypothetical protein